MLTLDTRTPTGLGAANPELMSVWTLEIQKRVDAFINGYKTGSVDQQALLKMGNKISKRVMRIRTDIFARIDYIEMGYKLKEPGITADEVREIKEERRSATIDAKESREWARDRYKRKKELAILRDALDTVKERYNEIDIILDDIPGNVEDEDNKVFVKNRPVVAITVDRRVDDEFSRLPLTPQQRKCLRMCKETSTEQLALFKSTQETRERVAFLIGSPLIIHMDMDIVVRAMLRDKDYRYKCMFELPGWESLRTLRYAIEGSLFEGLYDEVTDRERVKYGLLHVSANPNGNRYARFSFGSSYAVLSDHVKDRITITRDDSGKHKDGDPIGLRYSCEHLVNDVFESDSQKAYVEARLRNDPAVVGTDIPGYERRWIEAQIHGDVNFATDIAKLMIDGKWKGNVSFMEALNLLFRNMGVVIPYEFIENDI